MKSDKIKNTFIIPLYIIILIIAIPILSETIYTPSLPSLAKDLAISANLAEYTLTIYLFGFAVGVLLWGNLSDSYGRKPCLLIGFLIYALSCYICYLGCVVTRFEPTLVKPLNKDPPCMILYF